MPEPKTLLEANSKLQILKAFTEAKDVYLEEMEKIFEGQKYLTAAEFEAKHSLFERSAINGFTSERKLGGKKLSDETLQEVR
jgi:hypothetical protein